MPNKIRFTCAECSMTATLDDSPAAGAVFESLPFEGILETTGMSFYFPVDVAVTSDSQAGEVEEVDVGAVAYWPAASSLCVFYGSQPMTPVVIIGKVDGDSTQWRRVMSGQVIQVERA